MTWHDAGSDQPAPEVARGNIRSLRSISPIDVLVCRPSIPANYEAESRALIDLARELSYAPTGILQKLVNTVLVLCRAHSAGISVLEEVDHRTKFHWRAIAGQWAGHLHGTTPRDFSPCGTVIDQNTPLVCSRPERDFPYFGDVTPFLEEALLVPFYVNREAIGTIWVVSHDASRRFNAEDLRVVIDLSNFAAAAYQTTLALNAAEHFSAIVESSDAAVLSSDLNSVITTWNRGAERVFGYKAEEAIGKPLGILIPADCENHEERSLRLIQSGKRIERYETARLRKDGRRLDMSLTVSPIRNAAGEVVGVSTIAHDISDRKQREAHAAILAQEAEHRAKNVLATVQAIVRLSQSDTPDGLRQAVEGRIQALANVHTLFVQSRWLGADLHSLLKDELSPYDAREGRICVDGPKLMLAPDKAQAIAVTIHELATNAAKYGALSAPEGTVHIEWLCLPEGEVVIRWTETGGPAVKPSARRGFGTRVMKSMILSQQGKIRFEWRPEGLFCELTLNAKDQGTPDPAPGPP